MNWTECISEAIRYIEDHITEELTIADIAKRAAVSPFYFQKGFGMPAVKRSIYTEWDFQDIPV